MELAGLEASRSKLNIPVEELFKNIEEIWIILGRQPKYNEIKKPLSKYSAGTYDKRFGSWIKALQQFVDYINSDSTSDGQTELIETELLKNASANTEIKHRTKREISDRLRFRILMRDGFTCRKCGIMVFKDSITGVILLKKYVKQETNLLYFEGIKEIIRRGIKVQSIICDGRKGLFSLFGNIPMQYCQFHQIKTIRGYLTKKPKLQASKE
ncbi:MAG: hypothetical protein M9916_11570 [Crocinitomicaceae bacterium]|nr:hypothetical protein [Crocinitomicaceae bacterium]